MDMRKIITLLFTLVAYSVSLVAQTEIEKPNFSVPSLVAPAYFGPNAFPVPDMTDGTVSPVFKVELYGDGFTSTKGYSLKEDLTMDIFAKATIPLFTNRVNLVIWMPIVEYYKSGPRVNAERRISNPNTWKSGIDTGDAYVSTDILLLEEDKNFIGMVLRTALKSASGNSFSTARVYDSPGYFFDVSVGRNVYASLNGKTTLRMAVSAGFLCWQTDNGRQNDAVMYGMCTTLSTGQVSLRADYGGYVGWEGYGDMPMTLKTKLSYAIRDFSVDVMYQVGFIHWPFHQLRFGATYVFPCRRRDE